MTSAATPATDDVLPPGIAALPDPARRREFALALTAAALLHLSLILTVSLRPPAPGPVPELAMEVLLLSKDGQAVTPAAESTASEHAEPVSAQPATTQPPPRPAESPPMAPLAPLPQETKRMETPPVQATKPATLAMAQPLRPPLDAGSILASRNQEVARLAADLDARAGTYAARPRRKSVSASTREYRYANYLSAWARKVERIGNLNYPLAAKEQNLYGSLILDVAVRADGSVEQIRLVRSSGSKLLDEAAIQIVELAAPYSPFPPDIATETDVLNIVRTWQFLRGGGLGWER